MILLPSNSERRDSLPQNADAPFLNRALQGLYPPGSTFKPFIAALALERNMRVRLDCPAGGYLPPGGAQPIRDHEYYAAQRGGKTWKGQGRLDLKTAFARSSNIYFAKLGAALFGGSYSNLPDRLLFNRALNVLKGTSGNLAAAPARMDAADIATPGAFAQTAIGQGRLLVTPLQMALLTAAIANDGLAQQPRLALRDAPTAPQRIMPAPVAGEVARLMRAAVQTGTGRGAEVAGLQVAGKTGTAQNPGGADHAWFICFAPLDHPRIALVVLIENGGFGADAAVPVASSLLRRARELGYFDAGPAKPEGAP